LIILLAAWTSPTVHVMAASWRHVGFGLVSSPVAKPLAS
jgi:hypothetical protein